MPNSKMFRPVQVGTKKRYTYARSQEVLGMPHLLDLQTKSYEWFCKEGLRDVFADISPIEDSAHKWALHFGEYYSRKKSTASMNARREMLLIPLRCRSKSSSSIRKPAKSRSMIFSWAISRL